MSGLAANSSGVPVCSNLPTSNGNAGNQASGASSTSGQNGGGGNPIKRVMTGGLLLNLVHSATSSAGHSLRDRGGETVKDKPPCDSSDAVPAACVKANLSFPPKIEQEDSVKADSGPGLIYSEQSCKIVIESATSPVSSVSFSGSASNNQTDLPPQQLVPPTTPRSLR
ncbi:unnamed protein product [Protopolystoma xenopodis]|uniref:Uncharacterized protein n=1 Tax=Protopolystoma xenopodis TaxID=117903 RepID=A0A448WJ07_9PLAT|nr:unnamed protein product [Protopolystoma xenopodis]